MKRTEKTEEPGAAGQKRKNRKNTVPILLFGLLILAVGVCVLLYPTISNYFAEIQQLRIIEKYQDALETTDLDYSEEWELAYEYNSQLTGDVVEDPFQAGSGYTIPDNYEDVLNISGDGIMGYLSIPEIDVSLPIYHGTSDEVLNKGVGHVDYSSLPIGGEGTHCILAAHRGLTSAKLFTDLDKLEIGDMFYITVLDETLAYEVDQITVVEPDDFSQLQFENDQDYCTLLTCTPYGINTERLLVRGHRVEYEEDTDLIASREQNILLQGTLGGLIAAAVVLLVIWLVYREVRKQKQRSAAEGNSSTPPESADSAGTGSDPPGSDPSGP